MWMDLENKTCQIEKDKYCKVSFIFKIKKR